MYTRERAMSPATASPAAETSRERTGDRGQTDGKSTTRNAATQKLPAA